MDDWTTVNSIPRLASALPRPKATHTGEPQSQDGNPFAYSEIAPEQLENSSAATFDELIDPGTLHRMEAINKDSKQFAIAMLLSLCCVYVTFFILPIWYGVRLYQWGRIMSQYPELSDETTILGPVSENFPKAKNGLIAALVMSVVIPMLVLAAVLFLG